ncbi:MAG: hypothetical protein QG574_1641, partial [Cyanobacteriota bacterium erpe_2018_sw_21hr_WHONDRS-SW48-000092_B_bin.40]|nr:hypothetical protein [Cyanobacteriota bacterium erpe_2018_sw_21hr_WHONDRS-SW48-000092_B_bin.40]
LLALPIFTARHTWIRLALALTVLSLLSCAPPVRALAGRVLDFPTSRSVGKLTALSGSVAKKMWQERAFLPHLAHSLNDAPKLEQRIVRQ